MDAQNLTFPILRGTTKSARSRRGRRGLAAPLRLSSPRPNMGLLGLLLWQAAAAGVVVVSIALDGILRPSPGVELAWQAGAFLAALVLAGRGLARFVPDLDRRWRVRRRLF